MMNILIPTDFSDNSHNAIRYGLDYFANVPVNFHLLHVSPKKLLLPEKEIIFLENSSEMKTVQNVSTLLKETIRTSKLLSKNPLHTFYSYCEDSTLVEAIRRQVAEKEIDYILMGTKGLSKSNGKELGSNTYDIITKVKCPILVIPQNVRFGGIKNIAFVTDYNCLYRNKVISSLTETLNLHNAPLRILHIKSINTGLTEAQTDNKGFLHNFFKETKHSFHFVENRYLESGIQDFVETWDIGLVTIIAKNLNFIQRLLLRPTIIKANCNPDVPFLVLHE